MKSPLLPYLFVSLALLGAPSMAQSPASEVAATQHAEGGDAGSAELDPIEQLIREEEIRTLVDQAFQRYNELLKTEGDATLFVKRYVDIAFDIGTAEPGVIPLLANEMLQSNAATFYLSAYALGIQGTPEAIAAIREGIRVADSEGSQYAEARKAHLIWTLAVAGEVDAISLSGQGRHRVGTAGQGRGATVLEVVSILTYPESIPRLHEEFTAPNLEDPDRRARVLQVIRAMARLGDSASLKLLVGKKKSPSETIRQEIADALRFFDSKEAVDALFELLYDDDHIVAMQAANSLQRLAPPDRVDQVVAALAAIELPEVRRALYPLLASIAPETAVEQIKTHWSRPHRTDRNSMIHALGVSGDAKAIDLLTHALSSGDKSSATQALHALGKIGTERVQSILLFAISDGEWATAQAASKIATDLDIPKTAETIRKRLIERELPPLQRSASTRPNAEWLLDRLVELRDTEAIAPLRVGVELQRDKLLIDRMQATIGSLELVAENGTELDKWIASCIDDDESVRTVANNYLLDQPASEAISTALAKAFGRAEPEAITGLVMTLAKHRSKPAMDLIERVLTSEDFNSTRWNDLRDAAAWTASRYGGERMVLALATAIDRRQGRDARVLNYYAVAAGAESIERIDRWKAFRMRFTYTTRANEWNHLRRILIHLRRGEPIPFADVPPEQLKFMRSDI